ncbi:hypothetical protein GF326_01435 [Candidatus Bathyarchaeota archaeon]|nr:hypothetical protein [Candidatus Bathyarchaeota archaeon]
MSEDISEIISDIEDVLRLIKEAKNRIGKTAVKTQALAGEFKQEVGVDLENFEIRLQEIWNDLDSVLQEAKTLREDKLAMKSSIRKTIENEENYKMKDEETQTRIEAKLEERKEEIRETIEKIEKNE